MKHKIFKVYTYTSLASKSAMMVYAGRNINLEDVVKQSKDVYDSFAVIEDVDIAYSQKMDKTTERALKTIHRKNKTTEQK